MRFIISSAYALCVIGSACAQENWTQFRGPNAGVSDTPGLPVRWSTTENVKWSMPILGRGWSSPIVWGNRIFLTTVVKNGECEEAKKGLYFGGERKGLPKEEHRWLVIALDRDTGKIVWEREAHKGLPKSAIHIKNSYASETPVTDGERIYAYFGNQGIYCYDLEGKPIWSKPMDAMPTMFSWGTAASPVLHGDTLYIVNDNEKASSLVALDKLTGKQRWRVARDEKSNWATPFIWKNDQRTELVLNGTKKIRSYDLAGNLLWEMQSASGITIPTPLAANGLLYVGSGYVMDPNKPLVAIRPGAKGNITLERDQDSSKLVAWRQKKIAPYNPSFLIDGDYLYVLYDQGFLSCFNAKTGVPIYERQRLQGQFTVSPWTYGGHIFCLNEDGTTFVIKAGPEFEVVGKNNPDELCMSTPATTGTGLLIRTQTKLYMLKAKTP